MAEDLGTLQQPTARGPIVPLGQRLGDLYTAHERVVLSWTAVVVFLALWEYSSAKGLVNPLFVSAPSKIARAAYAMVATGEIWPHLSISAQEFFWGYLLGIVIGLPLGVLLGWYRRFNYIFDPFVSAMYSTPRIAFLPLIIMWFGIGMNSKVVMVFEGVVFYMIINTYAGVRTVDGSLLKCARSFGANDRQVFTTLALPSAVPFVLAGMRLGIGRGLIGIVVGELYAAQAGIGFLINFAGQTFQVDRLFVGVIILAVAGTVLTEAVKRVEKRFDAWRGDRPV